MSDALADLSAAGVAVWLDDLSGSGCAPATCSGSSTRSTWSG